MRDEFSKKTKQLLAQRSGYLCSFPGCRIPTVGPKASPEAIMLTGDAAHIKGASPKGPRFDGRQTRSRTSVSNGIWLCVLHARIIDADRSRYSAKSLTSWKAQHERLVTQLQLGLVRLSDGHPLTITNRGSSQERDLFLESVPFIKCKRDNKSHLRDLLKELNVKADKASRVMIRSARKAGYFIDDKKSKRRDDLLWIFTCVRNKIPCIEISFDPMGETTITIDLSTAGYAIPYYASFAVEDYVAMTLGGSPLGHSGESQGVVTLELSVKFAKKKILLRRMKTILSWLCEAGMPSTVLSLASE